MKYCNLLDEIIKKQPISSLTATDCGGYPVDIDIELPCGKYVTYKEDSSSVSVYINDYVTFHNYTEFNEWYYSYTEELNKSIRAEKIKQFEALAEELGISLGDKKYV